MPSPNANTAIYDRSVDRSAMVRLYENRTHGKTDLLIAEHQLRVESLIANSDLSRTGVSALRAQLDIEGVRAFGDLKGTSARSLLDLVNDQTSYMVQTLEAAISEVWAVAHPPRRIAEDIVLRRPLYNDKTLDAGWNGVSVHERIRLEQLIRKGIAEGLTPERIAQQVRSGNIMKITRQQSRTLVTTAMTSVQSQADHAVYKANEKALKGWQYVSVLDSGTTDVCIARDGKTFAIDAIAMLPPAHYGCRSTTIPVVLHYEQLAALEGIAQIRKTNLNGLSLERRNFYDGQTAIRESYDTWLRRQTPSVQLRHIGDTAKLSLFQSGQLTVDKFIGADGKSIGIKELRRLTDAEYDLPGQTRKFAMAKARLDTLRLGASYPDDFVNDPKLAAALREYYVLQAGELDGTLSLTNYRGTLIASKKATKARVLTSPPTDENLKFNAITGRYEDARLYQPSPAVLANSLKLVDEAAITRTDKEFITKFVNELGDVMGANDRAVVTENLRIAFTRARADGKPWVNFKAVANAQMKFDVMNVSDYMETQLRKDSQLLSRLKQDNFFDPVLGEVQLQDLHDTFIANIVERNRWEDKVAPKVAKELRSLFTTELPLKIRVRLDEPQLQEFFLRFANKLSMADLPDRDQLAVGLGRDLYNMANYRGSRKEWYELGLKMLDHADDKGFFKLETYGVQKRRMKSRLSNNYFGPYYDTFAVNLRIVDPRIQAYAKVSRKVDVGLRLGVTSEKNKLVIREGYKTYFVDRGLLGYTDTRIPITSTNSFSGFPVDLIDKDMAGALTWASQSEYRIDPTFYDFVKKIMYFEDDKGQAKHYHELNEYRKYMIGRGDAYERFKSMDWLRGGDKAFSNHPFLDHRARIYERGFIGPQSGETYRPFLSSAESKAFSKEGFLDLEDQVGAFLGGHSDALEGRHNALTITGRQKIALEHRAELIRLGRHIQRAKPGDIRAVLESPLTAHIEGEEQGKFLRFALEMSKIADYLDDDFSGLNLERLSKYRISVALEQDASSSGAQIIALATKNKQLAEMSNVVATDQKRRLYDEIAASTFNDERFRQLNLRLGLTEKDLRKAAKAQNMVTFYGAGERTGILNVENKLAKVLGKGGNTLVVKAAERDTVIEEISARMARYQRSDPSMFAELKALRADVKAVFDQGLSPGDDMMDQLYFLDVKTKDFVEKMTRTYDSVVTPKDFQMIANIMSDHLAVQVPILKDFTKFFGRLATAFAKEAKPSEARQSVMEWLRLQYLGKQSKRPPELLKRFAFWKPDGNLSQLIYGIREKKLPKKWTTIPWVNFDGKVIEQNFTQVFEEKLTYRDKDGNFVTNILQIAQKTDPSFWDEVMNREGTINDIVDLQKAATAFAVNGNHSNDAVIVKQFHMWGQKSQIATSTIHDAFFTNAADMLDAKTALRKIYANMAKSDSVKATLDEMLKRGLPKKVYNAFLNEAIDTGLIPVAGRSRIGGRLLQKEDILTPEEILSPIPTGYRDNRGWYGIGQ
jgi:SPP1 gp7 family putative phage head morphogenesis protein